MSAANSVFNDISYLHSDSDLLDTVKGSGYPSSTLSNVQVYIGDKAWTNTFSGFIRNIKIFSVFRSVGQSR